MKILKTAGIITGTLVLALAAGFTIWTQITYGPSEELYELVDEDAIIREDGVRFMPGSPNGTGVILYPGARVEPEAYSYLGAALAEDGYTVIVPSLRLNLAFFNINKAESVIDDFPEIENWVIGGHSLGGVAAASYAYDNDVSGVLFLASYPQNSDDFSGRDVPMLSIYAERDGLTTLDDIENTSTLLSDEADFHKIEGGNHAQFGIYGEQRGDMEAAITAEEQQVKTAHTLLEWLNKTTQK